MLKGKFNDFTEPSQNEDFQSHIAASNKISHNLNWKNDFQPSLETRQTYMERARALRLDALLKIKDFLQQSPRAVVKDDDQKNPGYYSLDGKDFHGLKTTPIDTLIADIKADNQRHAQTLAVNNALLTAGQTQSSKEIISLGVQLVALKSQKSDNRFLKSEESAQRKIEAEYTKKGVAHPEEIGDYLRFQVLYETAQDIAYGRHILQTGAIIPLTSQKDRLRFPHDETSHRAFLARSLISDGTQELKFEIMLSMVQAETFGNDKTLRDSSRACKKMASDGNSHVADFCAAAGVLDSLAQLSLCDLYDNIDNMSDLLDPSANMAAIRAFAQEEFDRNIVAGRSIVGRLPKALEQAAHLRHHLH